LLRCLLILRLLLLRILLGPVGCCSPRHGMAFKSIIVGSRCGG